MEAALSDLGRVVSYTPADYLWPGSSFSWWGYEVRLALHRPNRVYPSQVITGMVFIDNLNAFVAGATLNVAPAERQLPGVYYGKLLKPLGVMFLDWPSPEWIGRGKLKHKSVLTLDY